MIPVPSKLALKLLNYYYYFNCNNNNNNNNNNNIRNTSNELESFN
jgi:hypothetical protein